jgi:hydrogenase maturation protein HypF
MALSYLYQTYDSGFLELNIPLFEMVESHQIDMVTDMIRKGINCPLTSSLGRLFDGIAALCGIRTHMTYDGQGAVELASVRSNTDVNVIPYPYVYDQEKECYRIPIDPLIKGVTDDIQAGRNPGQISSRFHFTLIHLFADLCAEIGRTTGCSKVALSGGVFQNEFLLTGLTRRLQNQGFAVYANSNVPTNDGGVSLGQAAVAAAVMEKGEG